MQSFRLLVPVLLLAAAGCGQVDRQMTIRTQPEGALVFLNGQEVGRTPFTTDFTWYGWYDVTIRSEGHKTLKTRQRVLAPWWQWVPLDLVADVTPGRKVDRQAFTYTLTPQPPEGVEAAVLIDRAQSMRPLLESGEYTRRRPVGGRAQASETPDLAQEEAAQPIEIHADPDETVE